MPLSVSRSAKSEVFGFDYRVQAIGGEKSGGQKWWRTEADAIREIESGEQTYYVRLKGCNAPLEVAKDEGRKFLKTRIDKEVPIILLALPD